MNFDEAFDHLNSGDIASVAAQMADWHPAVLGKMLLAVETAKKIRYPLYHPDYHEPLKALTAAEPPGPGDVNPKRQAFLIAAIMGAVESIQGP